MKKRFTKTNLITAGLIVGAIIVVALGSVEFSGWFSEKSEPTLIINKAAISEEDYTRLANMLKDKPCVACEAEEEIIEKATRRESNDLKRIEASSLITKEKKKKDAQEKYTKKSIDGFALYQQHVLKAMEEFEARDRTMFIRYIILKSKRDFKIDLLSALFELEKKSQNAALKKYLAEVKVFEEELEMVRDMAKEERDLVQKTADEDCERTIVPAREKYALAVETARTKLGLK